MYFPTDMKTQRDHRTDMEINRNADLQREALVCDPQHLFLFHLQGHNRTGTAIATPCTYQPVASICCAGRDGVPSEAIVTNLSWVSSTHESLAPAVLPPLFTLLQQCERVTAAVACGGSATLTALAAAVSWDITMCQT